MVQQLSPKLPRNIIALGAVSFFTDAASEMIYPLLPIFLSGVLGANARFIGAIEGAAETVASLLKLASGWLADRLRRRKPLVVLGYAIATVVRPLTGITSSAAQVMAIRLTDRVGKGIRGAPRDALIADSAPVESWGRSFGFQRAADHAGAVVGPLVAFAVLWLMGATVLEGVRLDEQHERAMRTVFLLSAIPGALALLVLVTAVRETPRASDRLRAATAAEVPRRAGLGPGFTAYMVVILLFTLGNSTDAFLLLRAQQLGVPLGMAPVLWAMLHVVKASGSTSGGILSDRLGRRPVIGAGWLVYSIVYAGFALASRSWHAWALFAAYGVYFSLTEGSERALVADLVPEARRGAAYGWYNLVIGIGALPASLIFGWVWDTVSAPAAFAVGAGFALAATVGLLVSARYRVPEPPPPSSNRQAVV